MLRLAFSLALLGGLLGQSVEVLRLEMGGMAATDWRLRVSLFAAYGAAAFFLSLVASFLSEPVQAARRRAIAAFGVLLILPWLNFDYLPRFFSWRTWAGSAVAVVVIVAAARAVVRVPRIATAAVLALAVAANAFGVLRPLRETPAIRSQASGGPRSPVVLVLIDTLRADHLGVYGYERPTSPNLDRLAGSAVVFEDAVAQAAWTKPSTASLLTGTYVHRHGVISTRDALGTRFRTLAEMLSREGYRTAGFSANPWITPEFGFDRGFGHFVSQHAMGPQLTNLYRLLARVQRAARRLGVRVQLTRWVFSGAAVINPSNSERDELLAEEVSAWIDEHAGEPFFLYVHLIGPHDPYDPPEEHVRPFLDPEWDGRRLLRQPPPRVQSIFERAEALPEVERAGLIAQYDGAISFADSLLGRIAQALDRHGILDETLLIVTSDHGEEFYEHGNWRHGNQLYGEVVRVPLVVRLPGRLPAGRRSDPAMLIDVVPSVVGLLGLVPGDAAWDGRDLFAPAEDPVRPVFAEHWRFEGGRYMSRMVVRDGLKLCETRDEVHGLSRFELYDLGRDPREETDMLGNGRTMDRNGASGLETLLASFGVEGPESSGRAVDVGRSTEERLRALGY
jgi:arylsulfatase A-like enzyme